MEASGLTGETIDASEERGFMHALMLCIASTPTVIFRNEQGAEVKRLFDVKTIKAYIGETK